MRSDLDELDCEASEGPEPNAPVGPDSLAYILYTSGSTGAPKGVLQNHRNVLHFIRNYTNNLAIGVEDRLTLLSSYSFDAAVMDIFGALLNGATLHLLDVKEDGLVNLSRWLREEEITIYHSTPTVYRYFVKSLKGDEEFSKLRLVVLGGEEVCLSDVESHRRYFSDDSILVNGFGPTESTVTLQNFVSRESELKHSWVPVGFPVEETEILLLDKDRKKAGVQGEIAIKSRHVALGYWRKPELTEAAFLPAEDNKRIYCTGDLGRLAIDGSIEYVGRKDHQVKVRGYRIELGEIEAALSLHPCVRECVVVARQYGQAEQSLVAYVVAEDGLPINSNELRRFLREKLPGYMVPPVFAAIERIPVTPTGKIDRRALPDLDQSLREVENRFVSPRTPTERTLAKVWAELLRVDQIGIHDDFFELGGHSLLAMRVVSRIVEMSKVSVPLRALFETPTIADLSAIIDNTAESSQGRVVPKIRRFSREQYRVKVPSRRAAEISEALRRKGRQ